MRLALRVILRYNFPDRLLMRVASGGSDVAKAQRVILDEIVAHFQQLEDPRSTINRRHPLPSVVVIALLAVLAGAGGPTAIARWAEFKQEFLTRILELPYGVPGKDVFRRMLMVLDPAAFQACFAGWLHALRAEAVALSGIERPILSVDGKTMRRSHDAARGLGPLHSVSVWAGEYGLSLGQLACAEKSNEITAIPELLGLVDIQGAIITIDAMGTQAAIAEHIVDAGADYVLALKRNQATTHQQVVRIIEEHLEGEVAAEQERVTSESGHGREETRTYLQIAAPAELADSGRWKGLKSIGLVTSSRRVGTRETVEARYYLSSLGVDIDQFARAVRGHWSIENACHWSLDVSFGEDQSRVRQRHLMENFGWLNRFGLSLLKQHPGRQSVAMKRRGCGWSDAFLLEVVTASTC